MLDKTLDGKKLAELGPLSPPPLSNRPNPGLIFWTYSPEPQAALVLGSTTVGSELKSALLRLSQDDPVGFASKSVLSCRAPL